MTFHSDRRVRLVTVAVGYQDPHRDGAGRRAGHPMYGWSLVAGSLIQSYGA